MVTFGDWIKKLSPKTFPTVPCRLLFDFKVSAQRCVKGVGIWGTPLAGRGALERRGVNNLSFHIIQEEAVS